LLKQAAAQGHTLAMCQIGNIYWDGAVGVAKDTDQALAWYHKAAALEEPLAEGRLATAYEIGLNVPKDPTLAYYWARRREEHYLRRAEQGDPVAQLLLGMLYEWGDGGIAADKSEALYWYQQLAQQGGLYKDSAERYIARLKDKAKSDTETGGH
jgi:hypothetical protein